MQANTLAMMARTLRATVAMTAVAGVLSYPETVDGRAGLPEAPPASAQLPAGHAPGRPTHRGAG